MGLTKKEDLERVAQGWRNWADEGDVQSSQTVYPFASASSAVVPACWSPRLDLTPHAQKSAKAGHDPYDDSNTAGGAEQDRRSHAHVLAGYLRTLPAYTTKDGLTLPSMAQASPFRAEFAAPRRVVLESRTSISDSESRVSDGVTVHGVRERRGVAEILQEREAGKDVIDETMS
ncbi:hypothetical protein LTR66_004287 [Elasticomyces elasticus]|nr:hypothetical protein LTR66_004287 [Elasticomyces elasticus]